MSENYITTCPHNGIEIVSWYASETEQEDNELLKLIPFLKNIVKNKEPDVREILKEYGYENSWRELVEGLQESEDIDQYL